MGDKPLFLGAVDVAHDRICVESGWIALGDGFICRALTNLVVNGVATIVISRWEGELDVERLNKVMAHPVALGEEFEDQPA